MKKQILFVGGFWDDKVGKKSRSIIPKLVKAIQNDKPDDWELDVYNGGNFNTLKMLVEKIRKYSIIYWFANVPNKHEKLVADIKKNHKKCILVTSKRNDDEKYDLADIINHALKLKSNLVVEFKKEPDLIMERKGIGGTSGGDVVKKGFIKGRVLDPLANVFLEFTADFDLIGMAISKRVWELNSFSRVGSIKMGEALDIPVREEFFKLVKDYAEVFHDLIHHHPEATNRFFGNATFRCERGFPSFKDGEVVFVSRRNMDKRFIDKDSFVAVDLNLQRPIMYYGDHKPSVDTPIQLHLYWYYKNIRYMIHSHAYIVGAPMTEHVISCGAVEEFDDITLAHPNNKSEKIFINLRGHGSIAMVKDVSMLADIPYISMEIPHVHENYVKHEKLELDLDSFWQDEYFYTKYDIGGRGHSITIKKRDKEAFIEAFKEEIEKRLRGQLEPLEEED